MAYARGDSFRMGVHPCEKRGDWALSYQSSSLPWRMIRDNQGIPPRAQPLWGDFLCDMQSIRRPWPDGDRPRIPSPQPRWILFRAKSQFQEAEKVSGQYKTSFLTAIDHA